MIKLSFKFYFGHQLLNISRKSLCVYGHFAWQNRLYGITRTKNFQSHVSESNKQQNIRSQVEMESNGIHPYGIANGRASTFLGVSNANRCERVLWPFEQQQRCGEGKEMLCVKKKLCVAAAAMKCKVFPSEKREKETNLYAFGVGEAAQQLETNACVFVCFYGKSFKGRSL